MRRLLMSSLALTFAGLSLAAGEIGLTANEKYDYAVAMKQVAKKFTGTPGVILLLGDSITFSPQNTAWALQGQGQTPAIKEFLKWSHTGEKNDKDGWTAARQQVEPGRSATASNGVTSIEYLNGGKHNLPPLRDILKKFNPQMIVYMLGTNDTWQDIPVATSLPSVEKAIDAILANGTIPVLSTIPAFKGKADKVDAYNAELRKLAEKKKIPLLDLFVEMKTLGGNSESFLEEDGIHLSSPNNMGAPTAENFKRCGYLFRCYLNVLKLMEVKAKVIDTK